MTERGLLDWPGVVFGWINDGLLLFLPLPLALLLWGVVSGWATMWVYRRFSNQDKLAALVPQARAVRRELANYDGEFSGLFPLMRENFRLSGRHIGLALGPALLAGVPVLFVLVWISNAFGAYFPEPGARVNVEAVSTDAGSNALRWRWQETESRHLPSAVGEPIRWRIAWPEESAGLVTPEGETVAEIPPPQAAPVLHPRRWWNVLIANPAGYLPPDSPADSIRLNLPVREILPFGPDWMRGWMFPYFVVLIIASLGFKFYWRVH